MQVLKWGLKGRKTEPWLLGTMTHMTRKLTAFQQKPVGTPSFLLMCRLCRLWAC